MSDPRVVVITVPGLRGHVEDHWQTHLAAGRADVIPVPPLGRDNPSLAERVAAIQRTVVRARAAVILVAHSAGVISTVHWAAQHHGPVRAALLATPPDLGAPLPPEYPSLAELRRHGWLPIPRHRLPFPSIVAASSNDSLGDPERVRALADGWGSQWRELGAVGHLNPASGYGNWPEADVLVDELIGATAFS
jgi:predicted alpha/beta hydrolase family esterase